MRFWGGGVGHTSRRSVPESQEVSSEHSHEWEDVEEGGDWVETTLAARQVEQIFITEENLENLEPPPEEENVQPNMETNLSRSDSPSDSDRDSEEDDEEDEMDIIFLAEIGDEEDDAGVMGEEGFAEY